jgi:hypothetical protein
MTRNDVGITIYPTCSTLNKGGQRSFTNYTYRHSLFGGSRFHDKPHHKFAYAPFQFRQFWNLILQLRFSDRNLPSSMPTINSQIRAFDTNILVLVPNQLIPHQIRGIEDSPVIKLLASLIRNAAAPLYSSGRDNLPSIFCFGHSSLRSGNFSNSASTMAVTI